MKKYASSFFRLFLLFLLGFIACSITGTVIKALYSELNVISEKLFPIYSRVTDKDKYFRQQLSFDFTSALVSVFIINFIAIGFDNEKMEHLISKTDGLYTIRQGAKIYFERYLQCDITTGAFAVLPTLLLSKLSLPDNLARLTPYHEALCAIPIAFTEKFGSLYGALLLITVSAVSRLPAAFFGIRRWRALWLSDIVD